MTEIDLTDDQLETLKTLIKHAPSADDRRWVLVVALRAKIEHLAKQKADAERTLTAGMPISNSAEDTQERIRIGAERKAALDAVANELSETERRLRRLVQ